MAVLYSADIKNARLQVVADALDGGKLEFFTASLGTLLAEATLSDPSGTVASGVLTLAVPLSDPTANAGGVAAEARIKDAGGNVTVSGLTVGGIAEGTQAGKDIVLNAATIVAGQTITISAGSITHA